MLSFQPNFLHYNPHFKRVGAQYAMYLAIMLLYQQHPFKYGQRYSNKNLKINFKN